MKDADIGLIGLAVMGENLAMNIESKGFHIAVYNRTHEKIKELTEGRGKGKNIIGAYTLEEFVDTLKAPRKVILMVKAGQAVDDFIEQLVPLLNRGDIIIDAGNAHYQDTIRRTRYVESKGLLYVGAGVSGGEEGALLGPSIMPGGSPDAWPYIQPVFHAICAKVDGNPCCDWVGANGAGHFVKMVHNGIEYGDIQLICEAYFLMREYLDMSMQEMHDAFESWNAGKLGSYLIEITGDILGFRDESGEVVVEKILDVAGQKGTGKWTSIASLDEGVPLPLISEAVYSRYLSSLKDERVTASKILSGPSVIFEGEKDKFIGAIEDALYASKIVSYAQGFALLKSAAATHEWDLDFGSIALMWRGGCIIRSVFLDKIKEAFNDDPGLNNLLLDPFFSDQIRKSQTNWRRVVSEAMLNGIPVPAIASALSYYDGYRSERLPANLLQAQRDYFGAHNYERVDKPRGEFCHTNWTGRGGTTSASTYKT